ncbi:GH1 family beta-glucosidase [Cellulomonas sp. ATA003]|uniref:GH1 family beta-glucosidase n=1 Tax=Cellulomonas sp. ATA003 TaxID=3073064 RepID=UPI002873696C|nr:GH1 family beta-glucosidase [Cellulomonas sp. ATA003]WNB86286.1 GH1 family beta-glucosidase [Cellulomonas sp. ATA003]
MITTTATTPDLLVGPGVRLDPGPLTFPPGFLWGAATAAYQVEGAAHRDGRTDSIWDTFARVPGAVLDAHDGEVACGHYDRFRDDVALMRGLHLGSYRFSTSWARVRPDGGAPNAAGLDFYSRLVDELLEAGIAPWLTLYHWDLPQALEDRGGWANRDTAYHFAEYAATMHDALGDRVGVWTTLNEPWCSAFLGYTGGIHAPGRQSREDGLAAAHHLLLAHGLAVETLRSRDADLDLGITLNFTVADPADPQDPADVDAARRIDAQFNRIFLDPIIRGEYPEDLLADVAPYGLLDHVRDGDLALISAPIDALGVNYYHGEVVGSQPAPGARQGAAPVARATSSPYPAADGVHNHPRGLPVTSMDWEVQPEGLTRLLLRLQRDYTGPAGVALYVTENGAAYDDVPDTTGFVQDDERLRFFDLHLRAVHAAIDEGADVRGYFAWSLMDNYEWAWGYHKRFGIVRVDYDTLERTPKASARWYAEVARDNALPSLASLPHVPGLPGLSGPAEPSVLAGSN